MTLLLVLIILILLVVLLYVLAIMPRLSNAKAMQPFVGVLFAHRGLYDNAAGIPENSLAAFKRAVEAGYGVELDVQLTRDKIPVVFHDFTLRRMARYDKGAESEGAAINEDGSFGVPGLLSDYTYAELKQFHLLNTSERIPLFTDVLKLVQGRVPLLVEIKSEDSDMTVCEKTQRILRAYGGKYLVESFNPLVLNWYRAHADRVVRGQLSEAFVKEDQKYSGIKYKVLENLLLNFLSKPDFIAYNHKYADNLSLRLCLSLFRARAAYYTVRTQEELDRLRRGGSMVIFEGFVPDR